MSSCSYLHEEINSSWLPKFELSTKLYFIQAKVKKKQFITKIAVKKQNKKIPGVTVATSITNK